MPEIVNSIDWPCDLHLSFLEENSERIYDFSAVNWLLENETNE